MQGTQNPNPARSRSVPASDHRPDPRGAPPPYAQATAGATVSVPARLLHQARVAATQARATPTQARARGSLRQFVVPSHTIVSGTSYEDALARLRAAPRSSNAPSDHDIEFFGATKVRGNDNVVDTRLVARKLAAATGSRFPLELTRAAAGPACKIVFDVSITIEGDRNKIICTPSESAAGRTSDDAAVPPGSDEAVDQGSSSEQVTTEQDTSIGSGALTTDSNITLSPATPDEAGPSAIVGRSNKGRRATKRPAASEPVRRGRGRPRKQPRSE